ncbi:thioredoxin family protein [Candidatus Saccharibacteria bacterium]|nr:thioredoxin family protein [Candidatus Saccharibacteria bacterium]
MNKKITLVALVILLCIGGSLVFLLTKPKQTETKEQQIGLSTEEVQTPTIQENPTTQPAATNVPGKYVDYSSSVIAETSGTKILFFHAPWCPQCRSLESDINSKGVPSGVTIIKVDYDSNQALRQQYGVTLQTTIVKIDDNGNLVDKFVAYDDPTLQAIKDRLL